MKITIDRDELAEALDAAVAVSQASIFDVTGGEK